jgi:DNA-binding transcriptional MerR regulator
MSTVYSIKDLEKLSGIKAHTLRIWEKRYGIIKPRRTESNIRYFLDADLKDILNIAILNKNGIKISKIAEMKQEDIANAVNDISVKSIPAESSEIDALSLGILNLDEPLCKAILERVIQKIGFEQTIDELIYPMLDKLSVMWISGSLKKVHETFITTLLKQRISAEIINLESPIYTKSKFLIYLPQREDHELSILFLEYKLKSKGASVINLGIEVQVEDLIEACKIYKPDYLFTIINDSLVQESLQSYLDFLSRHLPDVMHLFTGFQFVKQEVNFAPNCKFVENLNAIEHYI